MAEERRKLEEQKRDEEMQRERNAEEVRRLQAQRNAQQEEAIQAGLFAYRAQKAFGEAAANQQVAAEAVMAAQALQQLQVAAADKTQEEPVEARPREEPCGLFGTSRGGRALPEPSAPPARAVGFVEPELLPTAGYPVELRPTVAPEVPARVYAKAVDFTPCSPASTVTEAAEEGRAAANGEQGAGQDEAMRVDPGPVAQANSGVLWQWVVRGVPAPDGQCRRGPSGREQQ